jgi:ketosteroid isomerase-like protein
MRTEILPSSEMPAMTADHMRRAIAQAFQAYETGDRDLIERVIADEFSFTSPYDDAIGREDYFRRCWPNSQTTASIRIERIFIDGDAAYVTYLGTNTSGRSFRNTEYMTFRAGQIASVEVYFGPDYANGAMVKRPTPH